MADPKHLSTLLEGVNTWNQWREDEPEVIPDLSGALLQNMNLAQVDFRRVNLYEADLEGADLSGANLEEAALDRAWLKDLVLNDETTIAPKWEVVRALVTEGVKGHDLFNVQLIAANLDGIVLSGLDLTGIDLMNASLKNAKLNGATLNNANLAWTDFSGSNFQKAKFNNANLKDINAEGANFENTTFRDAEMEGANLEGCNLDFADLTGANLTQANLTGASLRQAMLHNANLEWTIFEEANMEGADFKGASLETANLDLAYLKDIKHADRMKPWWKVVYEIISFGAKGQDLSKLSLRKANLSGADLEGANLIGANLECANLERANLKYTQLSGAEFYGTNFSEALLHGIKLPTVELREHVGGAQFYLEVFPNELDVIDQRRHHLTGRKPDVPLSIKYANWLKSASKRQKSAELSSMDLAGLAISGGGIRSATFALGVIQSLHTYGAWKHIDYLSTVSGGGYIGSCLSAALSVSPPETEDKKSKTSASSNSDAEEKEDQQRRFPFRYETGKQEPHVIHHLRNSSKYLASGGLLNALRLPTTLVRGILSNFWAILLYLLFFVFILEWVLEYQSIKLQRFEPYLDTVGLILIFLMVVSYPILEKIQKWRAEQHLTSDTSDLGSSSNRRARYENITVWLFLTGMACILWLWIPPVWSALNDLLAPVLAETMSRWIFFSGVAVTLGLLIGFVPIVRKPIGLFLASIAMPAIILITFLACYQFWDGLIGTITAEGDFFLQEWTYRLAAFAALIAIIVYTEINYNPNNSSMHRLYRDRLSNAYLVREKDASTLESVSDMKLSRLNQGDSVAPYHLINVALNLQGSNAVDLRGRNADFFFFSSRYIGGLRTGFCKTALLERTDPHVNLGTAMAISGAAASPNMGVFTLKGVTAMMTLLNIRLGYWLPNPRYLTDTQFESHLLPGIVERILAMLFARWKKKYWVGPRKLVTEALGWPDEQGSSVNLSDGGHIENLGLYELLRRRCKYIIAVDGEADTEMGFGSLLQVIRYARIDMGIEIEIDLSDLRLNREGGINSHTQVDQVELDKDELKIEFNNPVQFRQYSNKHWALGKINYGDVEGYLLYIKSTTTKKIDHNYIHAYQQDHPNFPHESTADQFFDEAQFEVYRELGYQSGKSFFEAFLKGNKKALGEDDFEQIMRGEWS